jgi:hypothetical protein
MQRWGPAAHTQEDPSVKTNVVIPRVVITACRLVHPKRFVALETKALCVEASAVMLPLAFIAWWMGPWSCAVMGTMPPYVGASAVMLPFAFIAWWMGPWSCAVMGTMPPYAEVCAALEHVWGMHKTGDAVMGPVPSFV